MSNNRQQIRRLLFVIALPTMPVWETWTVAVTATDPITGEPADVHNLKVTDVVTKVRGDFKAITRAARRRMARDLTKRQWAVRKVN